MGLMQLMPGTARRLGVRKPFDAAENIRAGTQYMRELMDMFGGKVDLVLASYNAGEGAVLKYGRNVPPYRETRDYVKTIGKRYGLTGRQPGAETKCRNHNAEGVRDEIFFPHNSNHYLSVTRRRRLLCRRKANKTRAR